MTKKIEFEAMIEGYNASPFLIQFELENGTPSLISVNYDSLELSIPDLTQHAAAGVNDAIAKKIEKLRLAFVASFSLNMTALSQKDCLYGYQAKHYLESPDCFLPDNIKRFMNGIKYQIFCSELLTRENLGETFDFFNNEEYIF